MPSYMNLEIQMKNLDYIKLAKKDNIPLKIVKRNLNSQFRHHVINHTFFSHECFLRYYGGQLNSCGAGGGREDRL